MSEIERIILEAEGKTSQANGALVGSGQSAESALNDAAEALRIALEVSDVSMDDLMRKMRELSAKAIGERGRADDLAIQVDNRNEQLKSKFLVKCKCKWHNSIRGCVHPSVGP